jgi:hypothetical protein
VLTDEKVPVFFIIKAAQVELIGLGTSLNCNIACFTFLLRKNSCNTGSAKLHFCFDTEKRLAAPDQC